MQPNREFTELGLPQNYHRRLERIGIHTIADLCAETAKELRSRRFIGAKTIHAIEEALGAKGLYLADAPQRQVRTPNPYSEFREDDISRENVPDERHRIWDEGYEVGQHDLIEQIGRAKADKEYLRLFSLAEKD